MVSSSTRKFEDKLAVRERTPLLIGLMGPSGSGKTYSALRLATGIVSVTGGDIFVIDTEARRAMHYADKFKFRYVEFTPPFGPLDYLAALEHCYSKRPGVVIVDSMSHEHEGPGGVLEMHEQEVRRMAGDDPKKAERVKLLAWNKPKQERRRLINRFLQMQTNFIFCFRAKEKIKPVPGKEPEVQGFMPLAGDEFVYEMTVNCLLYPSSGGVPTWKTNMVGEKQMTKLPAQFANLLTDAEPLSEKTGATLARWAEGTKSGAFEAMAGRIASAASPDALEALVPELTQLREKKGVPPAEYKALREAYAERMKALEEYARANPEEDGEEEFADEPEADADAEGAPAEEALAQ